MENKRSDQAELDQQIALRLRQLRQEKGLSLDQLAALSGVSRATLSRLENAEVSPTTAVLAKLCTAHGLTLSRLMQMAEEAFPAVVRREAQPVWTDPETGHRRRVISPPPVRCRARCWSPFCRPAHQSPMKPRRAPALSIIW
ncbi:helix-turn-helix transcriptional regulator [Pannonibacter sp. Pt2-lr]